MNRTGCHVLPRRLVEHGRHRLFLGVLEITDGANRSEWIACGIFHAERGCHRRKRHSSQAHQRVDVHIVLLRGATAECSQLHGRQVAEGDLLGLIEGGGAPRPVKAPCAGVVARVFIEDGAAVEFGQPLLFLEPR